MFIILTFLALGVARSSSEHNEATLASLSPTKLRDQETELKKLWQGYDFTGERKELEYVFKGEREGSPLKYKSPCAHESCIYEKVVPELLCMTESEVRSIERKDRKTLLYKIFNKVLADKNLPVGLRKVVGTALLNTESWHKNIIANTSKMSFVSIDDRGESVFVVCITLFTGYYSLPIVLSAQNYLSEVVELDIQSLEELKNSVSLSDHKSD